MGTLVEMLDGLPLGTDWGEVRAELVKWHRDHPVCNATREQVEAAFRSGCAAAHCAGQVYRSGLGIKAFFSALGQEPPERELVEGTFREELDAAIARAEKAEAEVEQWKRYNDQAVERGDFQAEKRREAEAEVVTLREKLSLMPNLVCLCHEQEQARIKELEAEVARLRQQGGLDREGVEAVLKAAEPSNWNSVDREVPWEFRLDAALTEAEKRWGKFQHGRVPFEVGDRVRLSNDPEGIVKPGAVGQVAFPSVSESDVVFGPFLRRKVPNANLYLEPPSPKRCGCGACVRDNTDCDGRDWWYNYQESEGGEECRFDLEDGQHCPDCGEELTQ